MSFLISPLSDSQVTSLVISLQTTEYLIGTSATIWLYDYLITLDREITLVWRSPWSFVKFMYFLNRYSPIIDIILRIYSWPGLPYRYTGYYQSGGSGIQHNRLGCSDCYSLLTVAVMRVVPNTKECRRLVPVTLWSYVLGFVWSEIILGMRTWAIWGATRNMLIFLITFTMGFIIMSFVLTQRIGRQIAYVPFPPVPGVGCIPLPNHETIWPLALTYMVNQAVITGLALFRGCQQYRIIHSPLWATMFHDGIVYYVYTLVLMIAYIITAIATPIQWENVLELPLRVLTSIFCTRVLLNIKGAHLKSISPSLTIMSMSMEFVVGRPGDTHSESRSTVQEADDEVLEDSRLNEA